MPIKEQAGLILALQASIRKLEYKLSIPTVITYYDDQDNVILLDKTDNGSYNKSPQIVNKCSRVGVIFCKSIAQMDLILISEWTKKNPKRTLTGQRDLFKSCLLYKDNKDLFCNINTFCDYEPNEIIFTKDEFMSYIKPSASLKQKAKQLFESIYDIKYETTDKHLPKTDKDVVSFYTFVEDEFDSSKKLIKVDEVHLNLNSYVKNSDGYWLFKELPKSLAKKLVNHEFWYLKVNGKWKYELVYFLNKLFFSDINTNFLKNYNQERGD